jgi:hypothetical protein
LDSTGSSFPRLRPNGRLFIGKSRPSGGGGNPALQKEELRVLPRMGRVMTVDAAVRLMKA